MIVFIVYIYNPVIHRKLQNVVYMKKKIDVKKKRKKRGRSNQRNHIGSCPQVPVICVKDIAFSSFYDSSIRFCKCSDKCDVFCFSIFFYPLFVKPLFSIFIIK